MRRGRPPSLEYELWPAPEQVSDALRLPYFAPALSPGQQYLIDKVSVGLGLVMTAPTAAVTASQRDELVWYGDPEQSPALRHYYLVAVDAGEALLDSLCAFEIDSDAVEPACRTSRAHRQRSSHQTLGSASTPWRLPDPFARPRHIL
jgi:hypothetical protein